MSRNEHEPPGDAAGFPVAMGQPVRVDIVLASSVYAGDGLSAAHFVSDDPGLVIDGVQI